MIPKIEETHFKAVHACFRGIIFKCAVNADFENVSTTAVSNFAAALHDAAGVDPGFFFCRCQDRYCPLQSG